MARLPRHNHGSRHTGGGRRAHRLFLGWTPVVVGAIADGVNHRFVAGAGDSWDRGARSDLAYSGNAGLKTRFLGQWDTVIGLSSTPLSSAFYSHNVGACYIGPSTFRPQRAGVAIVGSVDSPALTAGVSYLGVRRRAGNIQFFYSLNGTGSDETVLFSDADPVAGARLYLGVGAVWGGFAVGPVCRTEG